LDGQIDGYQRVQCEDHEEVCDWCRGMTGEDDEEEEEEDEEEETIDEGEEASHPPEMPGTDVSHAAQEEDDRPAAIRVAATEY
jgi:hypothetical protein